MKDSTSLSIAPVSTLSGARGAFLRTRDYLSAQIIGQEPLVEGLLAGARRGLHFDRESRCHLLHSFQVHYPIRFPRFATVG